MLEFAITNNVSGASPEGWHVGTFIHAPRCALAPDSFFLKLTTEPFFVALHHSRQNFVMVKQPVSTTQLHELTALLLAARIYVQAMACFVTINILQMVNFVKRDLTISCCKRVKYWILLANEELHLYAVLLASVV